MPARKRRGRYRRRKWLRWWYSLVLIAPLALAVVLSTRKHPHPPKRFSTPGSPSHTSNSHHAAVAAGPSASQIATSYNDIVTRAGGQSAWLKRVAQPATEHQQRADGEILALEPASQAIIRAMEQQAVHDGLGLQVQHADSSKGGTLQTTEEISVIEADRRICLWRLRQVPRLYRAAIVIDDLGQDLAPAHELLEIPYPLTFSVLPNLPNSRETAVAANRAGREVMLHLPMEPLASQVNPGKGAIRVGMQRPEVDRLIETDLASVPQVVGVNNHMGSRATSDPALMTAVMKELASRHLYFIDSRTTASTVAFDAARRAGIPSFYRSVFLDDTESVDYTIGQLRKFCAAIQEHGDALAIGHPHATTIAALTEFLPMLEREDIEVVPASGLVGLSELARLSRTPVHMTRNGH